MNAPTSGKSAAPALHDFSALNEEIAALVRAGIPLEPNLRRIGQQMPGRAGALAERIERRLADGESLAAAWNAESAALPATYHAVVAAGAESGHLGSALEAFVDSANRMDQVRRVTAVALLYPLVLVVIVCWLLALAITSVVPSFSALGPSPFGPVAWLADWPLTAPLLALGVPALAVAAAVLWWRRADPVALQGAAQWIGRLPGTGRVRHWSQAALFAEMLRLLVERGLPLDRSLQLAAGAIDDPRLRRPAEQAAEQIRLGTADPLRPNDAETDRADFPLLIGLALRHADDRPLLVGGLRQAATLYRERAEAAAEWHAEYLPLLLTVVIGGTLTVGFTLFILWPYVSMLTELSSW